MSVEYAQGALLKADVIPDNLPLVRHNRQRVKSQLTVSGRYILRGPFDEVKK